jgi:hypothetical protein
MLEDIIALVSTVAVIGGPIVLVAGWAKAATMLVRTYGELP